MRQGWKQFVACAALSCALLSPAITRAGDDPASATPTRTARSAQAEKRSDAPARPRRNTPAARQFTGFVTAVDPTTITVEKRGRNPETRVFVKHDAMRTTGDIGKDARVTVYYREEGGKSIAHRVVARRERASS